MDQSIHGPANAMVLGTTLRMRSRNGGWEMWDEGPHLLWTGNECTFLRSVYSHTWRNDGFPKVSPATLGETMFPQGFPNQI